MSTQAGRWAVEWLWCEVGLRADELGNEDAASSKTTATSKPEIMQHLRKNVECAH